MKTLRVKLLGLLIVTMCLSIAFFAGAANVQAQTTQTAVFEMLEGASVRTEIPAGIRFATKVNQAYKDTLSSDLSYVWGTKLTFTEVGGKSYAIDVDTQVWTDETQTQWNTVLLDIPKTDYLTEITAESYVKGYAKDDLEKASVVFSDTVKNAQVRSLAQTAALALNKGFTDAVLYDYVSVVQTQVELGATSLELTVGDETILSATNTGNYAMVYSSSDSEVVIVDNSGNVVAVGAGEAEITVQVGNNKATCTVTVSEKVKTTNEVLIDSAVQSYRDSENSYNYFYTNVNASEDSSEKYNEQNSIRYTVSDDGRSGTAGRRWFVPMEFNAGNPFSDLLTTMDMSVEDITAKTHVRFYVKNASANYELAFVLMDTSKKWFGLGEISSLGGSSFNEGITHINIPANSGWTKVDFSLSDVYESLINGTGRISLCAGFINTKNPFEEQTYYMGGFEVYTPSVNSVLIDSAPLTHTSGYTYFYTNLAVEEDSTVKYNEENALKYVVSSDGNNAGRRYFAPLQFDAENPVSNLLSVLGLTANDITANTYVRFYVKNTSNYQLRFIFMQGANINLNGIDSAVSGTDTEVDVPANCDWTEVNLPLVSVYDALKNGTEKVALCAGYLSTTNPFEDQTYYMAGFEIYDLSIEDLLPTYATYKAGFYEAGAVSATTTTLNDEKVVKYDVVISEKYIKNQTSTNINSNMFVADQKLPNDILEQCNVTATSWATMTITFKVYSDVVIGFNTFYKNGTGRFDGLISGSATPHASSKAGEWTTITLTVSNPLSSAFDGYAFRIGARSILSGKYSDYSEVGTHAYTYYVKDFNITVA